MALKQYTKCGSVSAYGKTCHNPEIKYGTTEGGIPMISPSASLKFSLKGLNAWCEMLGGTYESFTKGTRTGYCVTWWTGGDEYPHKWVDCGNDLWYNGVLDDYGTYDYFITSITCNRY